jgi:hypothetical protein
MEQILENLEMIFLILTLEYLEIPILYMNLLLARQLEKISNFNSAIH